jgi:signal transduction histidine kinase
MSRTLGWRQLRVLVGVAVLAVLAAAYGLRYPGIDSRGSSPLDHDLAVVAPLHEVLSPSAFAAYLVARSGPDLHRGIEYTLQLADGSVAVGADPAPELHPSSFPGFEEYPASAADAQSGPRLALRQCFANGDCLTVGDVIEQRVAPRRHGILVALAAFLLGIGFAAIRAWMAARAAARDLDSAGLVIGRLLDGDLAQRLPLEMKSGFQALSGPFNRLLERIEHLTLANRTVIDSTAHDLRAPLYRLRTRLEKGLVAGQSVEQIYGTVEAALNELDRIEAILDALLRITLAESGTASVAPVNVGELTADVIELYRPLAEDKALRLIGHWESDSVTRANAQLLAQAIANLLDNAIKFTPHGGEVDVRVIHRTGGVVIRVADTGPGIPLTDRARAMERSTRLANATGTPGSGLGLALVVAVARLHGGRLELSSNEPGLVAEIYLSRVPE